MEDNDLEIKPSDSLSNKGSSSDGVMLNYLDEIKEIEREKNKEKEKKPIPQSIIFTIFGVIASLLSYIETASISYIFFSFINKNVELSKLFLEDIKYISLFIVSIIIIKFQIKKPQVYQIILSFLFSFISYSSSYLYSRNPHSFILLSKVFCLLFVSIYFGIINLINIRKYHTYELPKKVYYGLILAISGILIEFISSYFYTISNGNDDIRFIYHFNDFRNFIISFFNGICYAIIIFLFDFYCKSLEIIFDTLFYIGIFSSIICFILSVCYSEITKISSTFSNLGEKQIIYYIICIFAFLIYIIFQSILIKKCSIYSAGIIISLQISIRIIGDVVVLKYGSNANIFIIISLILCITGLFIICLNYISNGYNNKENDLNNTESFTSDNDKKYSLINPIEQNDD